MPFPNLWAVLGRAVCGLVAAIGAANGAAAPAPAASHPATGAAVTRAVQATLRDNPSFPGVAAVVLAPGHRWSAAAGVADRADGSPLRPSTPFRVASITKTFTAAAVLRLVESGRLRLDDPVAGRVGATSVRLLRSDGYDPSRITLRMLLQHTAGLADYATDPAYQAAVVAHPRHRWTRQEQLRFAVEHGVKVAEPGRVFHYSDTGYILLGEVIERATGRPSPRAYRELLQLDRLGLTHTYFESLQAPRGDTSLRAHQYLGDVDGHGLDPSFDLYGGGGLVSTLDDLARFHRALQAGRVLRDPAGLAVMRGAAVPTRPADLGAGLFPVRLGDETCFGHQGFWGASVTSCPRSGITIATTVNQAVGFEGPVNALHARLHRLAAR